MHWLGNTRAKSICAKRPALTKPTTALTDHRVRAHVQAWGGHKGDMEVSYCWQEEMEIIGSGMEGGGGCHRSTTQVDIHQLIFRTIMISCVENSIHAKS